MKTKIAINKIHFPVTTLGYGKRIGIWMQGCSIHCPGCISRDTWDFQDENAVALDDLLPSIDHWVLLADGVTISGGEPFDQPEALLDLILELRQLQEGDILVYSGYPKEELFRMHAEILEHIDVLISEPYRANAGNSLIFRGSDNQRITLLTPLARRRYPEDINDREWEPKRKLDVMFDGDNVWMAGIPHTKAMEELKKKLASRGLSCNSSDQALHVRA